MVPENKLGISEGTELARAEERLGKQRAVELFDSGVLASLEPGTYESLAKIHECFFSDV